MQQADCVRSIWITGAIGGLVVMLFASGLGQLSWPGGLFLGAMTCLLGGGLLIWLLVSSPQPEFDAHLPPPPAPAVVKPAGVSQGAGLGRQDLTVIRGIGPKTQDALYALGVTRLRQIADWDGAAVDEMAARLGHLGTRIIGEDWPAQARALLAKQEVGHG